MWHKPNAMPESVTDRPSKAHEYIFLLSKSERYFYDAEAVKEPNSPTSAGNRKAFRGNGVYTNNQSFNNSSDVPVSVVPGMANEWTGRNKRTVWIIATAPYSAAHFAVFPPALVEPMILSGTSERGHCPECGGPWVRVVEKVKDSLSVEERHGRTGHNGQPPQTSGNYWDGPTTKATGEWQPTCPHADLEPQPALVLDPFSGSGTVPRVAVQHRRRYLGFELNEDYLQLAEDRATVQIEMF